MLVDCNLCSKCDSWYDVAYDECPDCKVSYISELISAAQELHSVASACSSCRESRAFSRLSIAMRLAKVSHNTIE